MQRQIEFDKNANAFAERYTHFLGSTKAAYQSRILDRNLTHNSIKGFEKEATNIAVVYLEGEIKEVERAEQLIKNFIETDFTLYDLPTKVLTNEIYMEYLQDFSAFVFNSIKHQVSKDILYATQQLRVESLKLVNNGYDHVSLFLKYKEPDFIFTDAIGRSLPSKKYIRTLVRDYFVKSYNDIFVENLLMNDFNTVEVDHADVKHKDYGLVLSINDPENELNYYKVRDSIFHPNSNAILKPVGV